MKLKRIKKFKCIKKRYVVITLAVLYFVALIYVNSTETPEDNQTLERIKDIVLRIVMVEPTDPEPSTLQVTH